MATRWFIVLSVLLACFDQITKFLARNLVSHDQLKMLIDGEIAAHKNEIIPGFFSLTLNFNKGIAWGMLPEWSEYFTYFAIIMVLVILMILRKLEQDEVWLKIALAFQMAGAIGNMTDRLVFHHVTDFIDVRLFFPGTRWTYDWPIFNLADSFVVVGTIILVTVLVFSREAKSQVRPAPIAAAGTGLGVLSFSSAHEDAQESLIELPIIEDGMLIPFEEADRDTEQLKDVLGSRGSDEKVDSTDDDGIKSSDSLDEFLKKSES